jgi:molybdopterin converting factor subunit 1
MIQVTVKLFGPAADLAGQGELQLHLPENATLAALRDALLARCTALAAMAPTFRFAVNRDYARLDQPLHNQDEIAVIPPVAGGDAQPPIRLTTDPIDPLQVLNQIATPSAGALVTFLGTVRAERTQTPLQALDYSAYEDMALQTLAQIRDEAFAKFQIEDLAILHRLGRVPVGQPSIAIVVAAAHRAPAFDACRFAIDQIKTLVPIFKKEVWQDGSTSWVASDPTASDPP